MSHSSSSSDRGAVEATVALAAVLAFSLGLSAYTTVLVDGGGSSLTAEPTLERVSDAVTVAGVADPARLAEATEAAASGPTLANATLTAGGQRWQAGPAVPATASQSESALAVRRIGVELRPGRVRPGRLRVVVWR